jgi:formamidopyrimidine-DNA glycosylase
MPELPEVETVKKQLQNCILNQQIQTVKTYAPKLRYDIELPPASTIITHIERRAKYIICHCKNNQSELMHYWLIHLGMTGFFQYIEHDTAYFKQPTLKHNHFEIHFEHSVLRYIDARRFGVSLYMDYPYIQHTLIKNLGIEPLSISAEDLAKHLYQQAQKRKQNIKLFLTNNMLVVGIGNIYACEILFQTGIHPQTICNSINYAKYLHIAQTIQYILQQAIAMGGSQVDNFEHVHIYQTQQKLPPSEILTHNHTEQQTSAYFQIQHQVYAREHKLCNVCKTCISRIMQGQRSTYFCPKCQI